MEKDNINEEIADLLSKVRTDPKFLIPELKARLKLFKGNTIYEPGEIGLVTNEGPKAVNEAISFLEKQKALSPLVWNKELSQACQDHVMDIGPKGLTGHNGSEGSTMTSRIEKYGSWSGECAENITYGSNTPEKILMSWIIDDGVKSRGHRSNIYNPELKIMGVAFGPHKGYDTCCTANFAGIFTPNFGMVDAHPVGKMAPRPVHKPHEKAPAREIRGEDEEMPEGCIEKKTNVATKISGNIKTITTTVKYIFKNGSTQTKTTTETITQS